jgi:hypothetical protein
MKRILLVFCAIVSLLLLGALGFRDSQFRGPIPLVRVNTEEMRQLAEQYKAEKATRLKERGGPPRMSPATIRLTEAALIVINHPWTSTPVISANVTMAPPVERRLFSDNARLSFNALHFNSPDPLQAVGFFLDPIWNRIIFANKGQEWIKSYGEWHGPPRFEYHLAGARALTIDISPNNAVYVADTENGRIWHPIESWLSSHDPMVYRC